MTSFTQGKRIWGPIKRGQLWRKKDTGRAMQVMKKLDHSCWQVLFSGESIKSTHRLKETDIYSHYHKIK